MTTRPEPRELVDPLAGLVDNQVPTTIAVCQHHDRDGLYPTARTDPVKRFTGIDQPYRAPTDPDLPIDTSATTPDEAAQRILLNLEALGPIK